MKIGIFLTLLVLIHLPLCGAEDKPRSFQSLAEATAALDRALAAPDPSAALNALLAARKSYLSEHPTVAEMLLKEHKRTGSFAKLYADRRFPATADTFQLGGHGSELGHIHIDFVRQDNAWRLKDIWNCR